MNMEKMTARNLLKTSIENAEKTKTLVGYRNPVVVQVAMVVDVDDDGRIRAYAQPDLNFMFEKPFIQFEPGNFVYHKTLDQVGIFIEVDQWDPSSASVNFQEDDGYDDVRRITLSLLTSSIPKEKQVVYVSKNNGLYSKGRVLKEIQDWIDYHKPEKLVKVDASDRELLIQTIYISLMSKIEWEAPITRLQEFDEDEIREIERLFHISKQI